jgi:hypothetical protein
MTIEMCRIFLNKSSNSSEPDSQNYRRGQTGSESASDRDHRGIRKTLCHPQPVPRGLWQSLPGWRGGAAAPDTGAMSGIRKPYGSAKTKFEYRSAL